MVMKAALHTASFVFDRRSLVPVVFFVLGMLLAIRLLGLSV